MNRAQERRAWEKHFTGKVGPKFSNEKVDGFDSKREAQRAADLELLQKIGEISNLEFQVRYEIVPKQEGEKPAHYVADFRYQDKAGNLVIEDAKGHRTREYILKRKLMLWVHGIRIVEV
jgi:Protein of unknown function (DUF1064)